MELTNHHQEHIMLFGDLQQNLEAAHAFELNQQQLDPDQQDIEMTNNDDEDLADEDTEMAEEQDQQPDHLNQNADFGANVAQQPPYQEGNVETNIVQQTPVYFVTKKGYSACSIVDFGGPPVVKMPGTESYISNNLEVNKYLFGICWRLVTRFVKNKMKFGCGLQSEELLPKFICERNPHLAIKRALERIGHPSARNYGNGKRDFGIEYPYRGQEIIRAWFKLPQLNPPPLLPPPPDESSDGFVPLSSNVATISDLATTNIPTNREERSASSSETRTSRSTTDSIAFAEERAQAAEETRSAIAMIITGTV